MAPKGTLEPEVAAVALEAARHLRWLDEEGIREVEPAGTPTMNPTATANPTANPTAKPTAKPTMTPTATMTPTGASIAARPHTPALSPADAGRGSGAPAYSLSHKGCGSEALLAVRTELGDCRRCKLAPLRTTLVFGVGNPKARLLFVGEGPGADEDAQGEPFVGKAGQLLTRMIEAMGFQRADVYIANVVKCRPPGNRDPEPDEIQACEPFLAGQIAAIGPEVIVALGRFAVQTLLRDSTPISRQRGRWREYRGVRLMPTFHPAYLLRNPADKGKAWEDLQLVMKELGVVPARR